MSTDDGVLISDGRCIVRLTRAGPPAVGYPALIDISAGPFAGSVRDEMLGLDVFARQLTSLYESLKTEVRVESLEGVFRLGLVGDGRGGVAVDVVAVADHWGPIKLQFGFSIDQSYLPEIIRQLQSEFLTA